MNLYRVGVIASKLVNGGRKHWGHNLELIAKTEAAARERVQAHLDAEKHPWEFRIVKVESLGYADQIRPRGQFTMSVAEYKAAFPDS